MIITDKENRIFTLHTKNTTYQMKVDDYGFLLHTYYGARLCDADMSKYIQYLVRSFSGYPYDVKSNPVYYAYSLDTLPQEYSTFGSGDYRSSALHLVNTDGSSDCDLRYKDFEIINGKPGIKGLPATYGNGDEAQTLRVTLRDDISGIEVDLYYSAFYEQDAVTRHAVIRNGGKGSVWLERAMSLCIDYNIVPNFDIMTFYGKHVGERFVERTPLRHGKTVVDSLRGASSHHQNPFVILCESSADEIHGDCYGYSLVYSGSFIAEAEKDQGDQVRYTMGIHPDSFRYELKGGDEFYTPEVVMSFSDEGLGNLSRNFHRLFRNNLCRGRYKAARRPVLINNWEATYFDFDDDKLVSIAEDASKLGIEMLVMDDGWFGRRSSDDSSLGDWYVNTDKIRGGLGELSRRINELGMKLGIWFEPEMISENSDLYRAHPDWCLRTAGRKGTESRQQFVLDMSRSDVVDYLYSAIKDVLSSANIEYVKWDMNRHLANVWSAEIPPERQGEVMHRYMLGLYDLLERLTSEFPDILLESCSGGGGRFDAGMLYYSPQVWTSDNTDAYCRMFIQYGTSFAYPVSSMGAHVSACPNHQTGRITPLNTRGVVAMAGTFGYELDINKMTEEEKQTVKQQVETFKKYYDIITFGDYYRLVNPYENERYMAWQFTTEDKSMALVNYVQIRACPNAPAVYLRLQGLIEDAVYIADGVEYTGKALMRCGMPMSGLAGDMAARQIEIIKK